MGLLINGYSGTAFCFVQFENAKLDEMPPLYLARPQEVAERLRSTAKGRGDTILYEKHSWGPRAVGAGTMEQIHDHWKFSRRRGGLENAVQELSQTIWLGPAVVAEVLKKAREVDR